VSEGGVASLDRAAGKEAVDLVIPAGETTKISSAMLSFDSDDIGFFITITDGTGFNTGTYEITGASGGVATLDGTVGSEAEEDVTGGQGRFSGAFSGVGTIKKALVVRNSKYYISSGDELQLLWDEENDRYQAYHTNTAETVIGALISPLYAGSAARATLSVGGTNTVTVYDKLLGAGESLDSGTTVVLSKIAGKYYVTDASCATS
jgi:hypothetical protein